ncbi:MAG: hypothetical protein JWO38_2307, partial [Gemmataceae bacterium]|nr:hypothetical protein [Gemmataceae bacterium]
VISGNRLAGIDVSGARTTGNLIISNYIGTDANGFASIPNGTGILIQGGAHGNQVGGWVPSARNVICGNYSNQLRITGPGTSGNVIQGNYIGVDASGESAAQEGGDGVLVDSGASQNLIGGTALGTGNLIGGMGLWTFGRPAGAGIEVAGIESAWNVIQGNWIGLDARGLAPLYNLGGGIRVNGAWKIIIGGSGTAQNVIGDTNNSPGMGTYNHILPGNWYFDSVRYIGHPERLGGSFRT